MQKEMLAPQSMQQRFVRQRSIVGWLLTEPLSRLTAVIASQTLSNAASTLTNHLNASIVVRPRFGGPRNRSGGTKSLREMYLRRPVGAELVAAENEIVKRPLAVHRRKGRPRILSA